MILRLVSTGRLPTDTRTIRGRVTHLSTPHPSMKVPLSALVMLCCGGAGFLIGCAQPPTAVEPRTVASPATIVSPATLYRRVQVGMSRPEVEALLGPPVESATAAGELVWYLSTPALPAGEGATSPGRIGIMYAPDGRVRSKRLSPSAERPQPGDGNSAGLWDGRTDPVAGNGAGGQEMPRVVVG